MKKLTEPEMLNDPLGRPDAAVVDVRSPDEYAAWHLPNAANTPIDELEVRSAELPPDGPGVTYCNMVRPGNSQGERAADLLESLGFEARALNGRCSAGLEPVERDKPGG